MNWKKSVMVIAGLSLAAAVGGQGREVPAGTSRPTGVSTRSPHNKWAHLGPQARYQLDRVSERNDERLVAEISGERLAYLFGENLTSASCLQGRAGPGPAADDGYRELALCFFSEMEQAIAGDASHSLLDSLRVVEVGPGPDAREDARVVRVQQFHEPLPVVQADARVFIRGGRIDAFAGNLLNTQSFAQRVSPARNLQRIADDVAGHRLLHGETQFDAELNRFVVRFYAEDRGQDPFEYIIDEGTGDLLAKRDAGLKTQKPIQSLDYPASWNPTGPSQKSVEMTIVPVSGGFSHELRNPAQGAPTYTYFSSGTFFPPGSPQPCNNEPRIPAAQVATSSAANPWSAVTSGGMFEAANAYYWLNQLNAMRTHWSSSFGYTQRQVDLDLIVGPCLLMGHGEYYATFGTGGDLYLGSSGDDNPSWNSLATMAHEYGHHVHDRYYNHGTRALKEGFAESFIARWLRFANEFRGEWPTLNYNEPSMGFQQHNAVLVNGEFVLGPVPGDKAHLYYPAADCNATEDDSSPGSDPYKCGGTEPNVFWELLWDVCRLGYGACNETQDIIQSGVYASEARRLANNAYTWAIYNMSSGGKVGEFFNHVSYYYNDKKSLATISAADYDRVMSVLAHHCLGYNNLCATVHKLPGSKLPSSQSRKGPLFFEAENGTSGSAVLPDSTGSSAGAFVWLSGPTKAVTLSATIPAGGTGSYKVKVAGRHFNSPSSTLRITPTGFSSNTIAIPASTWAWQATSTSYAFSAGQNVAVRVENAAGSIDLDVVVLEKQ